MNYWVYHFPNVKHQVDNFWISHNFFLIWHFNNSCSWSVCASHYLISGLLYRQGRKFESGWGDCAQINKDNLSANPSIPSIPCLLPGWCISSQHHLVNSHSSATLLVEQTVAVACNITVWSLLWHLLANPDPRRTQLSQLERPATVSNPNCSRRSCKRMQGEMAGSFLCPLCFLCTSAERIKRHMQVTLAPLCSLCVPRLFQCTVIWCVKHLTQLASPRLNDYW